jgi:dephospho-CoA kinase
MPDAEKRARATYVVDTGQSLPATEAQIDHIVEQLKPRQGTALARHWA